MQGCIKAKCTVKVLSLKQSAHLNTSESLTSCSQWFSKTNFLIRVRARATSTRFQQHARHSWLSIL